jgi:hypothetical protein
MMVPAVASELAAQKITEESGLSFDPHVVMALIMLGKGKELNAVSRGVH